MTSRVHSILPRIALAASVPLIVVGILAYRRLTKPYSVPAGSSVFDVAAGRWAWTTVPEGCDTSWHRISFSADHSIMTIRSSKPYERLDGTLDSIAVYDIIAHTEGSIRGAIRGEKRMTVDGKPVVWDLVLRSPDRYAWHRTDWIAFGQTAQIERCLDRK